MSKFGQYQLLDRIAVGGMAEIFRGRALGEEGFEKRVAIKRILPNYANDNRFVSMLVTEARIHAALSHRNIVQIHDLGVSQDGEYFIVLEYVDGPDLGALLARLSERSSRGRGPSRLPDAVALHIAVELAEGIHFAHQATGPDGKPVELVHRDISPSNVLLSYAGEVKLSDFGLAKRATDHSVLGSLKGKLAYMSPEQARRAPLDRRSDIFSLGAVLFEMLTGHSLRELDDDISGWQQVASGLVPTPQRFRPDIPPALERLLTKALAPDPRDRYSDVGEFLKEARHQMEVMPRSRVGEAGELAAILKALLPPGSPRPSKTQSRVIRLVSQFNVIDPSQPLNDVTATAPDPTELDGNPQRVPIPSHDGPRRAEPGGSPRDRQAAIAAEDAAIAAEDAAIMAGPPTPPPAFDPGPVTPPPPPGSLPPLPRSSPITGLVPHVPKRRGRFDPEPRRSAAGFISVDPSEVDATLQNQMPPAEEDGARIIAAWPSLTNPTPGAYSPTTGPPLLAHPGQPPTPGLSPSPQLPGAPMPPSAGVPPSPGYPPAPIVPVAPMGDAATMRIPGRRFAQPVSFAEAPPPRPAYDPSLPAFESRSEPRASWLGRVVFLFVLGLAGAAAGVHTFVMPLPVLAVWTRPAQVTFTTEPAGAKIVLDGKPLPDPSPTRLELPRDRDPHEAEIFLPGHLPTRRLFRLDRVTRIDVTATLVPEPPTAARPVPPPSLTVPDFWQRRPGTEVRVEREPKKRTKRRPRRPRRP